jgi:NADPH-dependent curcumin reductase CurA
MNNVKIIMSKRPSGLPGKTNFEIINTKSKELNSGEVKLEALWLSLDPYMRGTMNRISEGEVMMGEIIGKVIQSSPIVKENDLKKIDKRIDPLSLAVSSLGMPGLTAYFGLFRIGNIQKGDTVVVSAASGAVGSVVGQIAKDMGCKVIGIAGSDKKIEYIQNELGFDHGLNYNDSSWKDKLISIAENNVDIYFDNVGGVITDNVIEQLNEGARVIICGQISQYNNKNPEMGPRNLWQFLSKKSRLEGFVVYEYEDEFKEGLDYLINLKNKNKLVFKETVVEGIENAPEAFLKLFSGENFGKLLIKI